MKMFNNVWVFKVKLALGVAILLVAVGSFLAANSVNEMQVSDTAKGNISVEFKDADIHDVFRVLALKGNVSIVSDPEVKGLVTVQITDVPWEKVLDVICRTYGYAYERETNIIRVTTLGKQGLENLVTEVFTLNYGKAQNVASALDEMRSERGKIKFDGRANLVIVTDIPTNVYKIAKVIERLDAITPQVTIEAKIIETTLSDIEDLGMKWNASYTASMSKRPMTFPWPAENTGKTYDNFMPRGDTATSFHSIAQPAFPLATSSDFSFGILDGSAFSMLLEAIQTRGKTRILSNPRITTLDNEPAKIHVGTDWPIAKYSYNEQTDRFVITGWEYKSYGILLEVTPTINQNGYVTLKLHPEISDKQEEIEFQGARVPVLTTQSTDATVMIKDGQTLVIGGLIKDKTINTTTKVPFLGDIPLLGLLFRHKSQEKVRNDLLIFITPHIISEHTLQKRRPLAVMPQKIELNAGSSADEESTMGVSGEDEERDSMVGSGLLTPEEEKQLFDLQTPGTSETREKTAAPVNASAEESLPEAAQPEDMSATAQKKDTPDSRKSNRGFFFRRK
ncbi:MAG: type IV pilus secretin PilQ [Candidatus Omnitrophica bacterium]|nr:type IV pilus secretin PilQ [Candidatus Omnitrophota bacterium]MBU4478517.1 type IV pilus secretin PilQ [Candidatus Omnitrophota bacterium]MCG2703698.1 type IV pilus secretin PilQ [Candidatus Omnitrophota bacterium]